MHPDVPYSIILLCLMPEDFTCQGEGVATQWVKQSFNNNNNNSYLLLVHLSICFHSSLEIEISFYGFYLYSEAIINTILTLKKFLILYSTPKQTVMYKLQLCIRFKI